MSEELQEIEIRGIVNTKKSDETWLNDFLEWLESRKEFFGGGVHYWQEEKESSLEEKVVFVEKRYCEKCKVWTETPANYCKQCGSKLTFSPQKCSTDLIKFEDVKKLLIPIFKKELDTIINATTARNIFFRDEPEKALKDALKRFGEMLQK